MVYFQIKNTNFGFIGGSCNGKYWYNLWPFGIFDSYSVYLMVIWYILWLFGIYFPILVWRTKKNLATLPCRDSISWPLAPVSFGCRRRRCH
jgi:hypothetical protein